MTKYQDWLDRIENLIQMMHDLPYWDTVSLKLNLRELVELRMIISMCMELAEEKAKEFKHE